jgi:esterase/lipase superfamily enzyme
MPRALGSAALAVLALAVAGGPAVRGQDVWIVSTRRLPDIGRMPTQANVVVERHVAEPGGNRWARSDLATLLGDPLQPLVVFVHGNRYEAPDARAQGLRLARHLEVRADVPGRLRTVVFSWPSEQRGILLRDGRAKYERAHSDAHYMAWLLGHVEPTRPVAIVGYSFGSIITLEAIAELVAAERAGRSDVQPWTDRPGRTHLVFVAAAVRCDALAPRGPYRAALEGVDRLTLVLNSQDDALRFFPCLDRRVRADALGYVGMPRGWLPPAVEFTATDAASIVGKDHGLANYLASPTLADRIAGGATRGLESGRNPAR